MFRDSRRAFLNGLATANNVPLASKSRPSFLNLRYLSQNERESTKPVERREREPVETSTPHVDDGFHHQGVDLPRAPSDGTPRRSNVFRNVRTLSREQKLEGVQMFKTFEEAMKQHGTESTQKTFKLQPIKTDVVLNKAVQKQEEWNRATATNSILKERGSWSYDWRVPLQELRQNLRKDASPLSDVDAFVRPAVLYHQFSAREIFKPLEWSTPSFASYVKELASSQVARLMNRHLYVGHTNHVLAVRETLVSLFVDPDLRAYLSADAFEDALRFYYRHNIITEARKLFNIMLERNIRLRSRTLNIALCATAVKRDLHNFTYLLRAMINLGLKPSEDTWVSLVIVLESGAAKLAVVQNMRELSLLERLDVRQAISAELISTELDESTQTVDDVLAIMKKFDSQFGDDWFTERAGNIIIKHLCSSAKADQAFPFLATMVERRTIPNRATLDILLSHCLYNLDADGALQLLILFSKRFRVSGGEFSYNLLFLIAWYTLRYNLCRTIWWKACIDTAVSFRMQELTMRSLLRNTPPLTNNHSKLWMKEVGKVMVGISRNIDTGSKNDLESQEAVRSNTPVKELVQDLAEWSATGKERFDQTALAQRMMGADLSAFKLYRLDEDLFHAAFEEALKQDKSWHLRGFENIPLKDKIAQAIDIPVQYKVRLTDGMGVEQRKVRLVSEDKPREANTPQGTETPSSWGKTVHPHPIRYTKVEGTRLEKAHAEHERSKRTQPRIRFR
ncbi:hypothetical protein MMC10_002205 [Thelotrema lepadinum]|nr:hypothetical protein [Thelotrema lepadinum]